MFEPVLQKIPRPEFDYQVLLNALKDYSRPRDKISDLLRKQVIIRVKKGLYVIGDGYRSSPYSKELLANLIYGPSYVSLDYALQYHGMIPERVEAVTSVTTGRPKRFTTPLGLFIYRRIPLKVYPVGMDRVETGDGGAFLIATPEKALCDKIREDRGSGLRSLKDMKHYLLSNLRVDEHVLARLDPAAIKNIAGLYQSGKVRLLYSLVEQLKEDGNRRKAEHE